MVASPTLPCQALTAGGAPCPHLRPCPEHSAHQQRGGVDRQEKASRHVRGYDHDWARLRAAKLRADPYCEVRRYCHPGVSSLAREVDHIIPLYLRPDLRLAWSNLQSVCLPCHAAKTAQENRERMAGVVAA